MNGEGLSIGDWVSYRGKMPCKVLETRENLALIDNGTRQKWAVEYSKLEPIPITRKILFKNGFLKKQLSNEFMLFHGADKVLSLYDEDEGFVTGEYKQMTIHCVHELQHLLLLCGIEMNFEL